MSRILLIIFILIPYLLFGYEVMVPQKEQLIIQLAQASKPIEKIDVLRGLVNYYQNRDNKIALEYTCEISDFIEAMPQDSLAAAEYSKTSIMFFQFGIYDQALSMLLRALDIYTNLDDRKAIMSAQNNLGGVYLRIDKVDEALFYFMNALTNYKKNSSKDGAADSLLYTIYNNIGLVYECKQDCDSSLYYLNKAYSMIDTSNYYKLGQCCNNIARVHLNRDDLDKSLYYGNKALNYRSAICDYEGMAKSAIVVANAYMRAGDLDSALKYANEAESITDRHRSLVNRCNALELLSDIYEWKKEYKLANRYIRELLKSRINIINDSIISRSNRIDFEYKMGKRIAEINLENEKSSHRFQTYLVLVISLVIILIILYALIYNRNRRIKLEKESLIYDLEYKNKKLATNVMFLMKNSEMVKNVISRLIKLKLKAKREVASEIDSIRFDMENSLKGDLWNEFNMHFNEVHFKFYNKLKEYCSELSPNEIKLCALLRLNLSSKEIAAIRGISVKSVEVMRVRLRKKLQLSNTDTNLVSFLADF